MKTIFKLFVFGLVSAFIASSLTGCGGKKKPEADPVGPDIAAPADAGEDFNSWQKTTAIRAAIDEGRISQAKSMALKRIDSQPEDASAHYFLGRCLLEEGELNKARHSLTTAMKLDMGNRAYEREMGRCMSLMADDFLKRQMPSEAIANLKQAVSYGYKPRETEGKLAGAYKNTVDELLNSGNLVEAENLLRDSINLLPDRPELRVALAELLIEGDRLMEAERMLKSLTITNPDYEKGLNAYARLLYRMGEVSAAREMIDKSLKIAPADSEAIEIKNMLEQNVPVVKSPVEEQLTPQGAKELIADLDSLGKYAEQKRVLEQLIERYPEETWAYLALGRINDKLELYDEAFVNISEYLDRHPDSAEGKFQLARIQKQKGELESSLMLLQEISEKLNDKVSLLNESGQVYARMGRFDEAREHWNRALNLSEDNSESYFNLGQLAMETGDNKGAQEYFEKALRLSPDNAKFKYFAGLNLIQSGLKEQANNFWKASRDSLNPEDPYAERILRVIGEEQPQQAVQVQTLDPINMPVVQVPSSVINEAPVDSADYNRALEYARAGYFNEAINGFLGFAR
jgi:tetratricopeptide (TPR) repeat protein